MVAGQPDSVLETERKYEAEPDFAMPDLAVITGVAAASPPDRLRLAAIYFDTGDLRLAAARITLRRRTGGSDAGWHVKLPAGVDTRREVRFPAGRSARAVPARVAAVVSGWTGGEPLLPVARLLTARTVRQLTGPDGEALAEVADDLVTASRAAPGPPGSPVSWAEPLAWREIEVELAGGTAGLLDAAGQLLLRAGARPARSSSKLARLLGS
jgi:inorganic triphosphatase YgiF